MTLLGLSARNALRNRLRTALTVLAVAVALVAFVLLRTVVWAYTIGGDVAARDRVVTRHKVTFVMLLPKKYAATVAAQPGVSQVTWANWFGGKDPKHDKEFFAALAVDPATYLDVYDEMQVTPEEKAAWQADRRGCVVGDVLAKKLGWKKGDRVVLESQFIQGQFEMHVSAVYTATRKSVDRNTLIFHWDYMNESAGPTRDQIGWITSRVKDAGRTADVGRAIDKAFDDNDVQTLSQSERAFNQSFLGMFSAILKAIDLVSLVILGIMMLVLGNTIAMGVRERTQEYGALRALGFLPKHLVLFVLGEAVTIGLAGGLLGLALSYPIVERGMGRFLEENMGGFFPYFRISAGVAASAVALSVLLGVLAAVVPAWQTTRIKVVDALRRVA